MHTPLPFFLALASILALAKAGGYLSVRLGQPAVLGELIVGLVLGPTFLDILNWPAFRGSHIEPALSALAVLGVLILMFVAGLEVEPAALRRAGRPASTAGLLGVLAPLVTATLLFPALGFSLLQSVFLGLVLAATSVSISAQTLMELGVLRSVVGVALLGAAIIDDVLVVLLLAVVLAIGDGGGGLPAAAVALGRMALFLAVVLLLGRPLVRWLIARVDDLPVSEGIMALAIVSTLAVAWASEALGGMAAITGAFLAGVLFRGTSHHDHIEEGMHTLAYALLVPVFFVNIGLQADAGAIGRTGLPFAVLFVVLAVLTKVVGSGAGALVAGFTPRDALRLGIGMTSRGEVGLIVAAIGVTSGILDQELFATAVVMVLATTLLTPAMLRAVYPRAPGPAEQSATPVRADLPETPAQEKEQ